MKRDPCPTGCIHPPIENMQYVTHLKEAQCNEPQPEHGCPFKTEIQGDFTLCECSQRTYTECELDI